MIRRAWTWVPLVLAMAAAAPVRAQTVLPPAMQASELEERRGNPIPLDLVFQDQDGKTVILNELFTGGKPVLLVPAYFKCPQLCGLVLRDVASAIETLNWTPGKEFTVVTFSFDPMDKRVDASRSHHTIEEALGDRAGSPWPFLIGDQTTIARLLDETGYRVGWDEKTQQFAHPPVIIVLTPDGRVSRYLNGVQVGALDLKLALLEAGQGKTGSMLERVLASCYRYDPALKKYGPYIFGFLRLGALGILAVVTGIMTMYWRRERARRASEDMP